MRRGLGPSDIAGLVYNEDGLVPVIAQDRVTGAVLMMAWADQDALQVSLESGRMTYWSRSRQVHWQKGETSGHIQTLHGLYADCDQDALLAIVDQTGPACHTGTGTCWSGDGEVPVATFLGSLDRLVQERARDAPAGSYTVRLLTDPDLAVAKVLEEAEEVARVLRGEENDDTLEHEAADLLYHLVVALRAGGVGVETVLRELAARHSMR